MAHVQDLPTGIGEAGSRGMAGMPIDLIVTISEKLQRSVETIFSQIRDRESLGQLIEEIKNNDPELFKKAFDGDAEKAANVLTKLAERNTEVVETLKKKAHFFEMVKGAGVATVSAAKNILLYPMRHPIHTAIAAVLFMLATPYAASWFAGFERTLAAAGPMKKIIDYIRTLLPLSSVAAGGYKPEVFAHGTAAF